MPSLESQAGEADGLIGFRHDSVYTESHIVRWAPTVADRKSCAITTAKRLGQFLGDERIKDKGLVCNYVIARRPENLPTSERAIPVAIFSTSPTVQRSFLRKWCGEVGGGGWPPPLAAK